MALIPNKLCQKMIFPFFSVENLSKDMPYAVIIVIFIIYEKILSLTEISEVQNLFLFFLFNMMVIMQSLKYTIFVGKFQI